jgi:Rad3-related DNA helicase
MAKNARVIVTDYSYMFNSHIREGFFRKINKELKDAIIIIDEAHNLPNRVKDLVSEYLSNIILKRALGEAKKFGHTQIIPLLEEINTILESYAKSLTREFEGKYAKNAPEKAAVTLNSFSNASDIGKKDWSELSTGERYVSKKEFIDSIETIKDYEELVSELTFIANNIRETHIIYRYSRKFFGGMDWKR